MGTNRAHLIHDRHGTACQVYEIDPAVLGHGTFGKVLRGKHRLTGAVHAIKAVTKTSKTPIDQFRQEIAVMKGLDHPSIIKLYETFEDDRYFFLAMELCEGGDLYEALKVTKGGFAEPDARIVLQQILKGVNYLHEREICHRDLKPENFLLQTRGSISTTPLKIIDFGFARRFTPGDPMTTRVGTPYYVAPEVLLQEYNQTCDVWSCGVILYVLLCGYPPFRGPTQQRVIAKVRQAKLEFDPEDWLHIASSARSLVRKMIFANPSKRFSAAEALNHAWLAPDSAQEARHPLQQDWCERLSACRSENKLQKTAKQVMVRQMSEEEIKASRDIFMKLDVNHDGLLTLEELDDGLRLAGVDMCRRELEEVMDAIDVDGNGTIDYTEFLAASLEKDKYKSEAGWKSAFQVLDRDGTGKITLPGLTRVLNNRSAEDDTVKHVLRQVDANGDGCIDYPEFRAMMLAATAATPRDLNDSRSAELALGGC
jgi:calcium-dependent protein kinase